MKEVILLERNLMDSGMQPLRLIQLLLDETVLGETVIVSSELVRSVGGINKRLEAKQGYELMLRLSAEYNIQLQDVKFPESSKGQCVLETGSDNSICGLRTDCYVISKYKDILLQTGYFNDAVQSVLNAAQQMEATEEIIPLLERMLIRGDEYYRFDEATCPILIYKGTDVCYNILNIFAERLGDALVRCNQRVIYYNLEEGDIGNITKLSGKHFKAIIGIQTYAFSIRLKDSEEYLHQRIYGPKYNMVLDHPIWMKKHLDISLPRLFVLTHDHNYIHFIERYYHKKAYFLPPAGNSKMTESKEKQKKYQLSFVGTYGYYMDKIDALHRMERNKRFIGNRFLLFMRKQTDLTPEQAFQKVLDFYHIQLTEAEFAEQLYQYRYLIYCVAYYYREKVIQEILEANIQLDVFGDSWRGCSLEKYQNLVCHPSVTPEESMTIWNESLASLNLMTWHKDGFTERVASIMQSDSVLITDKSTYLTGNYKDGEDMIILDLQHLEEIPEKIKRLLEDVGWQREILKSAKQKVIEKHTWDKRAEKLLQIIEETEGENV